MVAFIDGRFSIIGLIIVIHLLSKIYEVKEDSFKTVIWLLIVSYYHSHVISIRYFCLAAGSRL